MRPEQIEALIEIQTLFGGPDNIRNGLAEGHTINWSYHPDNFNLKVWVGGDNPDREHSKVDSEGNYYGMTGCVTSNAEVLPRTNVARLGPEFFRAIESKLRKFLGI